MIWFGFQGLSEGRNIILNISNIIHDPEEQENIMLEDIKYNWNKRG